MSKVITSPVKRFPGTVTLSDPLTFPQVFAFDDAIKEVNALPEDDTSWTRKYYIIMQGICPCIEQWNLEGLGQLTADNFPATPKVPIANLIMWLAGEIYQLYRDAEDVPLE